MLLGAGSEEQAGAERKVKFSKAPILGAFRERFLYSIYFDGFISKKKCKMLN